MEGLLEEGSCKQTKYLEDLSEQTARWIKEEKVLPLREWVKQDLPEGLTFLSCFDRSTTNKRERLFVRIKDRKIVYEIIGKKPNDFIKIMSDTMNKKNHSSVIYPGDMYVKIWLNPKYTEFELKEVEKEKEKEKEEEVNPLMKMCCNLF